MTWLGETQSYREYDSVRFRARPAVFPLSVNRSWIRMLSAAVGAPVHCLTPICQSNFDSEFQYVYREYCLQASCRQSGFRAARIPLAGREAILTRSIISRLLFRWKISCLPIHRFSFGRCCFCRGARSDFKLDGTYPRSRASLFTRVPLKAVQAGLQPNQRTVLKFNMLPVLVTSLYKAARRTAQGSR